MAELRSGNNPGNGPSLSATDAGIRAAEGPRPQRRNHSVFNLTVNTNFRPKTNDEAYSMAASLRQAANHAFRNHEIIASWLKDLPPGEAYETHVDSIDIEFSIELGRDPRGRRVHLHAVVKATHRTKLQFNMPAVRDWFNQNIDDSRIMGVNVKVTGGRDLAKHQADYIRKDVAPAQRPEELHEPGSVSV